MWGDWVGTSAAQERCDLGRGARGQGGDLLLHVGAAARAGQDLDLPERRGIPCRLQQAARARLLLLLRLRGWGLHRGDHDLARVCAKCKHTESNQQWCHLPMYVSAKLRLMSCIPAQGAAIPRHALIPSRDTQSGENPDPIISGKNLAQRQHRPCGGREVKRRASGGTGMREGRALTPGNCWASAATRGQGHASGE